MGRRLKRERLYIRLIYTVVWQKPIQHCKAIILQLWGGGTTLLSVNLDFPSDPLWNVVTLQITGRLAMEGLMQQIWGGAWGTYNFNKFLRSLASLVAQMVKVSAYNAGDPVSIPGWGRSLEKEMATHSSILAWKIPWMKEPNRLQSMRSQRVGHNWATSLT